MPNVKTSRLIDCLWLDLFRLVLDVKKYPEFVPHCREPALSVPERSRVSPASDYGDRHESRSATGPSMGLKAILVAKAVALEAR